MHPNFGVILYGRIGHQADRVSSLQGIEVSLAVTENRAVNRGPEARRTSLRERGMTRCQCDEASSLKGTVEAGPGHPAVRVNSPWPRATGC